jgi:hypothetical protein
MPATVIKKQQPSQKEERARQEEERARQEEKRANKAMENFFCSKENGGEKEKQELEWLKGKTTKGVGQGFLQMMQK